jgi:two-component system sensor histidine kinase KdpD
MTKLSFLLSESEKLYKTLFNSISHELKTPITTIMTASASIADPEINKNQKLVQSFAHELNIAVRRLNLLVENLLDMARLESGVINIKSDWYYIQDLLSSVMNKMREEAHKQEINVQIKEDPGLIKFDFALIEQALINILRNSILYSNSEKEINVEVYQDEFYCFIKIADSGPGFPEGTLSRVFEKFYRVPGTKAGGTGLGLSIAKGFINAHNGTIEVSNRPEGGAEFIIKIPK